ncbi:hypothetical protein [Jannaschia formosa]|uniref:hypothetical protein n=1 Tax=Jannaschia formosa TaxID=2259592 RepID=UPI000E1BF8E5|nr:hypothetical protein [Jannaschia formosa]TFL17763.1 hypothetical protein DR046_12735 [Jannaschia formosa]
MKLASLTAAATLALSASAFAYTGVSPTMVSSVENILEESGIENVDITTLTDEQVVEIYVAGQQMDSNQQIGMIRAALDADNYTMRPVTERRMTLTDVDAETGLAPMGENSVVVSVQNYLDRLGLEADASLLTDNQVAEIYFLAYSNDEMNETNRDEVETILGM